jgi:hypothetical protein
MNAMSYRAETNDLYGTESFEFARISHYSAQLQAGSINKKSKEESVL